MRPPKKKGRKNKSEANHLPRPASAEEILFGFSLPPAPSQVDGAVQRGVERSGLEEPSGSSEWSTWNRLSDKFAGHRVCRVEAIALRLEAIASRLLLT